VHEQRAAHLAFVAATPQAEDLHPDIQEVPQGQDELGADPRPSFARSDS
jgi:hypothetical protein